MDQIHKINTLIDKIDSELGSERNEGIGEKWNVPEVQSTYMHPAPRRKDQIPIVADLECPDGIGEMGDYNEIIGRVNNFINISREFGF